MEWLCPLASLRIGEIQKMIGPPFYLAGVCSVRMLRMERSSGKNSEFDFLPILSLQKAKHALGTKCNGSQPINVRRNEIGKGITITRRIKGRPLPHCMSKGEALRRQAECALNERLIVSYSFNWKVSY